MKSAMLANHLHGEVEPAAKTLCLAMMVKDESAVIARCLETVLPYIDYWIITDTGSSDNTREIITETLASIPGELHEVPWENFGHNRSKLMEICHQKADYLLLLDADEGLSVNKKDFKWRLDADSYYVSYSGALHYRQKLLLSGHCNWYYEGVTHEIIRSQDEQTSGVIQDISYIDFDDGSRHEIKFEDDIRLLLEGLEKEPDNTRYMFYLARSYYSNQEYAKALEYFEKRIVSGDWEEEIYFSKLGRARCMTLLSGVFAVDATIEAHEYRPHRLEALFDLITHYRVQGSYHYAYMLCKQAVRIPFPDNDFLFVDKSITDYRLQDELAICAYWVGEYRESRKVARALLKNKNLPEEWKPRIQMNLDFATEKINGKK